MATMHYVTAILVPKGLAHPVDEEGYVLDGSGSPRKLRRSDMAKFFRPEDAAAHIAAIRGPGIFSLCVESREE